MLRDHLANALGQIALLERRVDAEGRPTWAELRAEVLQAIAACAPKKLAEMPRPITSASRTFLAKPVALPLENECEDCRATLDEELVRTHTRFGFAVRCPLHADAEQARARGGDGCDVCGCARSDEDDDGHAGAVTKHASPKPVGSGVCWVTVGGKRVCGACVAETLRARLARKGWTP